MSKTMLRVLHTNFSVEVALPSSLAVLGDVHTADDWMCGDVRCISPGSPVLTAFPAGTDGWTPPVRTAGAIVAVDPGTGAAEIEDFVQVQQRDMLRKTVLTEDAQDELLAELAAYDPGGKPEDLLRPYLRVTCTSSRSFPGKLEEAAAKIDAKLDMRVMRDKASATRAVRTEEGSQIDAAALVKRHLEGAPAEAKELASVILSDPSMRPDLRMREAVDKLREAAREEVSA